MATKKRASTTKVSKKPAVKKTVVKKTIRKSAKKETAFPFTIDKNMKSFAPYSDSAEFLSLRITRQTIYWSALLIYTLCLSLWVLKIQTDILDILNQIQ